MKSKNIDRRVRKTKKLLLSGLTKLLMEKSLNEISVRELSDLADINRGTFYLHYKDVFDMLVQVENEFFDSFYQMLNRHPSSILKNNTLLIFEDVFRFVAKNHELCQALTGKNGDLNFMNRLKEIVRDKCIKDWKEIFYNQNTEKYEFFYSYIVSGCTGLIIDWLDSGMKESPEQMAEITQSIALHGNKFLEEN